MAALLVGMSTPGVGSYVFHKVMSQAAGLLLVAGLNAGLQGGVGIAGYVGALA